MMVLHQLFSQDQPIVDIEVKQSAGARVEPQIAVESGHGAGRWRCHGHETEGIDDAEEARAMVRVDQEIEVGLPFERRRQVLVALPVDVGDTPGVQGVEQSTGKPKPVRGRCPSQLP
jgi:hypothetical protein